VPKKKKDPLADIIEAAGETSDGNIIGAIEAVTKKWTRQRKSEEKDQSRVHFRYERMRVRSDRVTVKDAAWQVMAEAYRRVSSDGRYPALARQVMYAARGKILELTGRRELNDKYFTQVLLPDYIRDHGLADEWDVIYDARGHFVEPHTELEIPLGTLEVRDYLAGNRRSKKKGNEDAVTKLGRSFPTHGVANRISAILFVEKEGFLPLLRAAHLAQRYDLALMSTKGTSVTAARKLVEALCALCSELGVPLLVLHDFDQSGFTILGTLQHNTRRYEFSSDVDVRDLGLRLEDVNRWKLEPEVVKVRGHRSDVRQNLRDNGATDAEIEYLLSGRRVELNAFICEDMIEWIESKLEEHGIEKVIPDEATLEQAYRRSLKRKVINDGMAELEKQAALKADKCVMPESLRERVAEILEESPVLPWDDAISQIVDEEEGTDSGEVVE
jgi:hypothetical protein